jgi:hypothetical protein
MYMKCESDQVLIIKMCDLLFKIHPWKHKYFFHTFFIVSDIYVLCKDMGVIFKVRKENLIHRSNFNVTTRYNIHLFIYVVLIAI